MSQDEQLQGLARDVAGRLREAGDTYSSVLAEAITLDDVEAQSAAIVAVLGLAPRELEGEEYLDAAKRSPRSNAYRRNFAPYDWHLATLTLGMLSLSAIDFGGALDGQLGKLPNPLSRESFLRAFAFEWIYQLRLTLCNPRTSSNVKLDALAATMAAAACHSLGMSEPIAIGVATLFIITVLKVTRKAFCNMSDMEILEELRRRAKASKNAPARKRQGRRASTKKKSK